MKQLSGKPATAVAVPTANSPASLAQHWTGRLHSPHLCHCTNINGAFWARLNNKGRAEEGDPGEFADDKQVRISESNGLHRRGEMWSGRITLRTKNKMISERDLSRTRSHVAVALPRITQPKTLQGWMRWLVWPTVLWYGSVDSVIWVKPRYRVSLSQYNSRGEDLPDWLCCSSVIVWLV